MVKKEKTNHAFRALNGILVQLRRCALMDEDCKKIAAVLDIIEPLPRFLCGEQDQTKDFEEALTELAERFPEFGLGLEYFRQETALDPW